jgi:hypothetical protein
MTKEELIEKLKAEAANRDKEVAHINADELLLEYINDSEIKEAYDAISKWYA